MRNPTRSALVAALATTTLVAVLASSPASTQNQPTGIPLVSATGCTDGTLVDTSTYPTVDGPNNDLVDDCQALVAIQNHWASVAANNNLHRYAKFRDWDNSSKINNWNEIQITSGRVTWLNLSEDELSGSIPKELGNLTNLEWLDLFGNRLTGSIPKELGNLTNLERLYLSDNRLTGSIPKELGNLTNLELLDSSENELTGSIPKELGNLTNLTDLVLNNNYLTSMPAELGKLTNLKRLYLTDNYLTGSIPAELGNLTNLERLYLRYNRLTGSIPTELESLVPSRGGKLGRFIICPGNQFTGTVPAALRSVIANSGCVSSGSTTSTPSSTTTSTTTTTTAAGTPSTTSTTTTAAGTPSTTSTTTTTTTAPSSSTTTTTTTQPTTNRCDANQLNWPALAVGAGGASIAAIREAILPGSDAEGYTYYRWSRSIASTNRAGWVRIPVSRFTDTRLSEGTIISVRCVTPDAATLSRLNLLGGQERISLRQGWNLIVAPENLTRPQGARSAFIFPGNLTNCSTTRPPNIIGNPDDPDFGITGLTIRSATTGRWSYSSPCSTTIEARIIANSDYDAVTTINRGDIVYVWLAIGGGFSQPLDLVWNSEANQYRRPPANTGPVTTTN